MTQPSRSAPVVGTPKASPKELAKEPPNPRKAEKPKAETLAVETPGREQARMPPLDAGATGHDVAAVRDQLAGASAASFFCEKSAAVTPARAPVVDAVKPATSVAQALSPSVQTSWLSQYA